jgi:hypothetical protein
MDTDGNSLSVLIREIRGQVPFIQRAGRKRGQRSARRRINSRANRGIMAWFKRVHRPNSPVRGLSKNKPPSATAATIPQQLHYASIFFITDGTD